MLAGVDEKFYRQLANGKTIVSEEIRVMFDPDLNPSFWRDKVRDHNGAEIDLRF